MKVFLHFVGCILIASVISYHIILPLFYPGYLTNDYHKAWKLIREPEKPQFVVKVVSHYDGRFTLYYVRFSNDNFFTWESIYQVQRYGSRVFYDSYMFDKQEAINLAKKYTSYEQCILSNKNAQARYDSLTSNQTILIR